MNTTPKTKKHGGFTLVETMAVIVILALLAAAAIFGVSSYMDRANVSKTVADLSSYDYAIQTMMMENADVVSGATSDAISGAGDEDGVADAIIDLMKETFASDLQIGSDFDNSSNPAIDMADPWGNKYYMLIDYDSKNDDFTTECFIYVYTYGGDVTLNTADDCYLVVQYSDGEVFSALETGAAFDTENVPVAFSS